MSISFSTCNFKAHQTPMAFIMRSVSLILTFMLCCILQTHAQSDSFVIRTRSMQATSNLFDGHTNKESFGLNLGYGKMLHGNHFEFDVTGFADWMSHNYYFDDNKRFEGSTLYIGFAVSPQYTINPESDVQFSIGFSLKLGYNQGYGDVKKHSDQNGDYNELLESRTVNGGYSIAFAPVITMGFPTDFGAAGLELGYDSSNFGQGLNKLRSPYYAAMNYYSGYLFLGVFFKFHN